MKAPALVSAFYERIWNRGELAAIPELLAENFSFRGSLGPEMCGWEAFANYVRSVRGSLGNYRCEILGCVSEPERAFAKMRFSGIHVAEFCGFPRRINRFTGSAPRCFVLKMRASPNCGFLAIVPVWMICFGKKLKMSAQRKDRYTC